MKKTVYKISALLLLAGLLILTLSACDSIKEKVKPDIQAEYGADSVNALDCIGKTVADISAEIGDYKENACANGGRLYIFKDGDYSFSAHTSQDAVETDLMKTCYILAIDSEVTPGVKTGETYPDYQKNKNINELSEIKYNKNVYAYSCSYPYTYNDTQVTVWLYFNAPDGKNTGAAITTTAFAAPVEPQPSEPPKFLMQYIHQPVNKALEELGDNYILVEKYNNEKFCSLLTKYAGAVEDKNTVTDNARVKAINITESDMEILPGFAFGKTHGEYFSEGNDFIGNRVFNSETGHYMAHFLVRVGAANVHCWIEYNDEDNTTSQMGIICNQSV